MDQLYHSGNLWVLSLRKALVYRAEPYLSRCFLRSWLFPVLWRCPVLDLRVHGSAGLDRRSHHTGNGAEGGQGFRPCPESLPSEFISLLSHVPNYITQVSSFTKQETEEVVFSDLILLKAAFVSWSQARCSVLCAPVWSFLCCLQAVFMEGLCLPTFPLE